MAYGFESLYAIYVGVNLKFCNTHSYYINKINKHVPFMHKIIAATFGRTHLLEDTFFLFNQWM